MVLARALQTVPQYCTWENIVPDYQAQAQAILLLQDDEAQKGGARNPYEVFKEKYFNDLKGFVHDCIDWREGEGAVDYQDEGLDAIVIHRRVSLRGPHGLGKTAFAAWVILWFALTRDGTDWKIACTASAWRQLTKFLWPEIKKWARRIKWELIGREPLNEKTELLSINLKLTTGEAFALASDNPALIEGAHADNILYVFDEAKTIPPDTWDAAEGAMSTGEAYMLAISTPGEPIGRFYDIHRRMAGLEDWWVRHVTKNEVIKAGRMNSGWADMRQAQWGADSAVFKNRVLGEFASSDEDGVISLSWVEASNLRWLEKRDLGLFNDILITIVSADIGRGGDPSVVGLGTSDTLVEIRRDTKKNTMSVTGIIQGVLSKYKGCKAIIDVIGVGAGVVDKLREDDRNRGRVYAFNASEATPLVDKSGELGFTNWRSAGWWTLRELLEDGLIDLPPDDKLTGDLTAPHYKHMSGGKIQIESKDDIRKRLKRSTDDGDMCMQMFAKPNLAPRKVAGAFGRK